MTGRDRIYRDPRNQIVDFAFDRSVADVFPDMIRRSVPAYETVVPLTGLIAARHLSGGRPACGIEDDALAAQSRPPQPETARDPGVRTQAALVFDLGCSLGATTLALLRQAGNAPLRIIAVDNSEPMLGRAAGLVDDDRVEFRLEDLRVTDVSGADVILMNYVLQFLPPADRQPLMNRFRQQMAPGGLLLISEKVDSPDVRDQAFFDATHLAFKQANGYSELEISGKRSALENVMIVDTEQAHLSRLNTAGFTRATTWFRCLNWASFLAWA